MPYTWTPDPLLDEANSAVAQTNEMQTNITAARATVGLGAYAWSRTPLLTSYLIDDNDMQDLRDALDEAETANDCITHYAGHNSSENTIHDNSVNGAQKTNDNPIAYSANESSNLFIDDAGENVGHQSTHRSADNSGYCAGDYSGHDATFNTSHYTTFLNGDNTTDESSHDVAYNASANASVLTSDDTVVNAAHYDTDLGANYSSNDGADKTIVETSDDTTYTPTDYSTENSTKYWSALTTEDQSDCGAHYTSVLNSAESPVNVILFP